MCTFLFQKKEYAKAMMMSLRLNETKIIVEVFEQIPVDFSKFARCYAIIQHRLHLRKKRSVEFLTLVTVVFRLFACSSGYIRYQSFFKLDPKRRIETVGFSKSIL